MNGPPPKDTDFQADNRGLVRRIAVPTSVFALAAVLVTAPGAAADTGPPHAAKNVSQRSAGSSALWATINICDTRKFPNAFGMRVSVPGNGSGRRAYARFTAQSWNAAKQRWSSVAGTGKSDWVYIGSGERSATQGGWTLQFSQPRAGTTYVVRGLVELNWRDGARASRRRVLVTQRGRIGVKGGDPAGTSKATCRIR
jgi:hypothetical protein